MHDKKLNIALIGYGKMGQTIEKIALERGHNISARIGSKDTLDHINSANTDVAIEFTKPESAFKNLHILLSKNIATCCGTTGWLDKKPEVDALCLQQQTAFLYASNFSVGVNVLFKLNKVLADIMAQLPEYAVDMQEIHHTEKKDAPSGTAISLAEQISHSIPELKGWSLDNTQAESIHIEALREENVPGTHRINYTSAIDQISLKHTAFNRNGFALGAVLAAEFIAHKHGLFTMADVLKL